MLQLPEYSLLTTLLCQKNDYERLCLNDHKKSNQILTP